MRVAVVGEAWGAEEEAAGKPFVGRAGHQLDKLLGASGIDRERSLITNVIHARPPDNDFGVYYADKARKNPTPELLQAHARLKQELQDWKPDIVIALGNEALFALTGKRGIEAWRGSVLEVDGIRVIPTFHPAALLRVSTDTAWYTPATLRDFNHARVMASRPIPEMPEVEVTLDPARLRECMAEWAGKPVAVDIETLYRYQGEQVACIGFSGEVGKAVVVPFVCEVISEQGEKVSWTTQPMLTPDNLLDIGRVIQEFFSGESWWKVGQNIQFDINVLRRLGWVKEVKGIWFDTMVAHANCVQPEFPHDLGFLVSWYTSYPYYKYMVKLRNEELWKYNGYDAACTLEIVEPMRRDMAVNDMLSFYHGYINDLIPLLADMNLRGIAIDRDYQRELKGEYAGKIAKEAERLGVLTEGKLANHRSSKQTAQYFYKEKGYRPYVKRGGGQTTDELALKRLYKREGDEAAASMLKLREFEKLHGTYASMQTDQDGMVRTTYTFASTGRFRSGGGFT